MFDYCIGERVAIWSLTNIDSSVQPMSQALVLWMVGIATYDDKPLYMHVHYLSLTLLNHSASPSTHVIRTNITYLLLLSCFRYEVVYYYHYIRFLALEVTVIPRQ